MVSSLISSIRGNLDTVGPDWADVSVGGVTFRLSVPGSTAEDLAKVGSEVRLFTSLQVREDSLTLYGFSAEEERLTFEVLIGINGVGPKVALSVLSRFTPASLAAAVSTGDSSAFTGVPGVGKKTASRILLELKGKLEGDWAVPAAAISQGEVVDALTALGYSAAEAREAVAALPQGDSMPLEDKLREALQKIGSG
jgi:Holliday junction DNA helicase RuvA